MPEQAPARKDPSSQGTGGRWRPHPRSSSRAGIRIFSSSSDASTARRPTDLVLLAVALSGIAILNIPAPGPTAIDRSVAKLVSELPGLFGWFWELAHDALLGWALLLVVLAVFAHGRKLLVVEELLAAGLAFALAAAAGRFAGTDWSISIRALGASGPPAVYVAMRLAVAAAVVTTASPHMSRPLRAAGRWVVAIGGVAGIALGVTLPVGAVAALLVGTGAAALVHLLFGSPGGRMTSGQVAEALRELGVETTALENAPVQPSGEAVLLGSAADGRSILVKVFGRDAWEGQVLTSTWSAVWTRGATPLWGGGRLQQVEHEGFVTLLAQRGGVPVMPVVAAGVVDEGDALLVIEITGRPFRSLASEQIDDALLGAIWDAVDTLHGLGIAHGRLDGDRIVVRDDGSPALSDFGRAHAAASDGDLSIDLVRLLVGTALAVGTERALDAVVGAIGREGLAEMLPYLQPAVMDRAARRSIRDRGWSVKELRAAAAERAGTELPPLEQVRRVTAGTLVKLAVVLLLTYVLITTFAGVSLSAIVDEFHGADLSWLIVALVLTPVVQVPQAFSTMGAAARDLTFLPVLMLQYGIQFIALAVPSSAGRFALIIRFFQRLGVPAAGAVSIGMIDGVSTFAIQISLILIILLSGLGSLDLGTVAAKRSSGGGGGSGITAEVLVIALGLAVVAGIVIVAVPRYRALVRRFEEGLRTRATEGREALRVLRRPRKLALLFGGNLLAQVLLAILLGLCVRAFGHSASLADLLLVNVFVSLFAGLMPVPGGVGVAEAGYTAGLIGIGVPSAAASSTAIAYRIVTFYLPPVWGAFAMRWMRRREYV